MRIVLDDQLRFAARDHHDPTPVDADHLLALLAAEHRRRLTFWLTGLLAVALVAGFALWYRPRVGPVPAPSPSATPAYTWDGTPPDEHTLSQAEAERRCPARAGERVDWTSSILRPGGVVAMVASTRASHGTTSASDVVRSCFLGYQQAPVTDPVTDAELAGDADALRTTCARHSGFDFDAQWRTVGPIARSRGSLQPVVGGALTVLTLVDGSGWEAQCAVMGRPAQVALNFTRLLDEVSSDCPAIELVSSGPGNQASRSVLLVALSPVPAADHRHVDGTVTAVEVAFDPPVRQRLSIPVRDGFIGEVRMLQLATAQTSDALHAVPYTLVLHRGSRVEQRSCQEGS